MLTVVSNRINDLVLNFDLNQKHDFTPKSESIKKYVDYEVNKVLEESRLNDKDIEHISFKPSSTFSLRPYFNNSPSYKNVGFTNFYITGTTVYTQESYYVFDLYDSFIDNNQTLLSRNFVKMGKVATGLTTDILFDVSKKMTKEFVNIYIPSYFINEGVTVFYLKIYFFNAISGNFRFFECSPSNEDSMKNYFIIEINKTYNTYDILNGDILSDNPNVYKISEIIEDEKEKQNLDNNKIKKTIPIIKPNKTITTKGKFI
jgi:hypothetical protein